MDHTKFSGEESKVAGNDWKSSLLAVFLLTLPSLPSTVSALSFQGARAEQENEEEKKEEEEKKFGVLGGWLNNRDPLEGMRYSAHQVRRLQPFPPELEHDPQAYVEQETIRVSAETTRTVIQTYHDDEYGSRRLLTVTEVRRTVQENGHEEAVKTISNPDANGRLQVQVEETQRVVARGEDQFEVQTIVSQLGADRRLEPVQQFVQTERRREDGTLELDRISYVVDGNRQWQATERRTAVTRAVGEERRTEEEVYRAGLTRRLTLSDRITSREREDEDGTIRRTTETRSVNPEGRLQLAERVNTVQSRTADGLLEIVQDLEIRNQGSGKMQLLERIVSSTSPGGEAGGSTEIRVEIPDSSGRLTVSSTYREERSGGEESERQTRTVKKQ